MHDKTDVPTKITQGLYGFFQLEIARLSNELGNPAPADTQVYLAGVLCRFTNTNALFQTTDNGRDEEPLALMLKRAMESDDDERVRVMKHLGDVALYKSGFFADRIERQGLDLEYYINMGGMAYQNVSVLSSQRNTGGLFKSLYADLSTHFADLVRVITEFFLRSQLTSPAGIMKLYKRWERTGSDQAARLLTNAGVILTPSGTTSH